VPWNGFSDVARDHILWGGIPDIAMAAGLAQHTPGGQSNERIDLMAERDLSWNGYWQDKSARLDKITVPAYVVADGLAVLSAKGSMDGFMRMASKDKWLRINDTQEWYDEYNPANSAEVLGHDGQESYRQWPIPSTRYVKLYLDAGNHSLNNQPVTTEHSARYDAKSGQVAFSFKFDRDTKLIGYSKARLYVEAQGANDMDLFLLAEKLDADGKVIEPVPNCQPDLVKQCVEEIGDTVPPGAPGRIQVSQRELDKELSTPYLPVLSLKNPSKLHQGEIVPIDVAIYPRAYQFHAGEQLRLTIAGATIKSSRVVPTINAGTHVIHTGGKYASYLQIPLVEQK
jgi:hypothetical protein